MSGYYNKDDLKAQLNIDNVFDLIEDLGGEPEYSSNGLIATTICHNHPGEGSRKLYYYENSGLFQCYSNCGSFDIFELVIKVMQIQKHLDWELYDAMVYIATYFGLGESERPQDQQEDEQLWAVFKRHTFSLPQLVSSPILPEYSNEILKKCLSLRIIPWEKEGITYETCLRNNICYYAPTAQVIIPHYDINNRLIGIRGRFMAADDAAIYGKYRPLQVNGMIYNHPLSMNLYNLNNSKDNIRKGKTAIVYESEKSCLMSQSYYGNNDISVACCGSSFSAQQFNLLYNLGVQEIIIAFDRQFQKVNDDEYKRLTKKLTDISCKYNNRVHISLIFDKKMITPYKSSPIDQGKEKFEELLKNRITL